MNDAAPLEGVVLTVAALNGLELAAANRDGRPLSTTDILLGLVSADSEGAWETIQLKTNFLSEADATTHVDPVPRSHGTWHNVPLTGTATGALESAVAIAADYHLVPMPPGALALGVLLDSSTGACRALLDSGEASHDELLELVQSELLGTELEGIKATDSSGRNRRSRLAGAVGPSGRLRAPDSLRSHDWIATPSGALNLLAAAVDRVDDGQLAALLSSMLLGGVQLRELDRQLHALPDVPEQEVVERAEQRFGVSEPDPAELIVAAALSGSERVHAALHRIALTPNELAAQIAEYRLRSSGDHDVSTNTLRFSLLNGLVGVITSVLVLRAAFGAGGHWWRVFFLPLVWSGYPQLGPLGSFVVAGLFAVLISPLVGAVHLVGITADLAHARAEQRALLARTGIKLSMAELRRVVPRFLNARARRMRSFQQAQRAARRARRDGRRDPYS